MQCIVTHIRRFYPGRRGGPRPHLGGENIIRRNGIMVYVCRYCVSVDKLKADQQLLSSFYYPYLTVIIDWIGLSLYLGSSVLLS